MLKGILRRRRGVLFAAAWFTAVLFASPVVSVAEEALTEVIAPQEETVSFPAQDAQLLWMTYGTPHSESGLSWDGNGNLHLSGYQGAKVVGVRGNTGENDAFRAANVTVTGDNTVAALITSGKAHMTITGGGTLRCRDTEGYDMVTTVCGNLTIQNVTLDLVSTSTARCFAIRSQEETGAYPITIRNSNIQITLNGSSYSFGIGSTEGRTPVTMENTQYTIHGANTGSDVHIHPVKCGNSNLKLNNVTIKATGRVTGSIWAGNLTADRLTYDADMRLSSSTGKGTAFSGDRAVLTNSVIRAKINQVFDFDELTMTNTKVDAAVCSVPLQNGMSLDGTGIGADVATLQSCDVTIQMTDPMSGGTQGSGYGVLSKTLTLADTKLRVKMNTSNHYEYAGIAVWDTMTCKGTTEVEVTSAGDAFWCSKENVFAFSDGLRILTPANAKIAELYPESGVLTVKDGQGQTAGTLKIGKGVAAGWLKDSKGWWYRNADGSYPKSAWLKIGGKWYYFDAKGYMQTGWVKTGGKWYYLNSSGAMVTGWVKTGGKWYYLNSSGAMVTGWVKTGGKWYYMNSSGAMTSGWVKVSGKWYYMNGSGAMQTGWLKQSGKWYYLDASGAMLANTSRSIGDKTYRFDASGVCTNP